MKKLLYIFLAVSIIFAACKKENNNSSGSTGGNTNGSILGKWNLIQYTQTASEGYYTNYPNGKFTTWDTTFSITPPDSDFEIESITWEFFSDQTMEEVFTEYGNPDSTDTDYYTWEKNGNILVLDTDWVLTINTLTANNLTWTDDVGEDTSLYNPSNGQHSGGDTVYFDRFIGTASWNRISGLSPNKSNARLKQGNTKKSILRKFINRRKK